MIVPTAMYHPDDEPGYDSAVYYDVHPRFSDYLAGLTPCHDDECPRDHVEIIDHPGPS